MMGPSPTTSARSKAEKKVHEFPETYTFQVKKVQDLRYGENPHQKAAFYREYLLTEPSCLKCAASFRERSFLSIIFWTLIRPLKRSKNSARSRRSSSSIITPAALPPRYGSSRFLPEGKGLRPGLCLRRGRWLQPAGG